VGEVEYILDGEVIGKVDITALESADKIGYRGVLIGILRVANLQILKLAEQVIELLIRDFGIILHIVFMAMVVEQTLQLPHAFYILIHICIINIVKLHKLFGTTKKNRKNKKIIA
jgi:hypothetical protein